MEKRDSGYGGERLLGASQREPPQYTSTATEWLLVRFNVDARSDDQLSLIQLAVLRQARAAINDQIAILEKRSGKSTIDRRFMGQATLGSQAARRD